jgi:hypothetical protein
MKRLLALLTGLLLAPALTAATAPLRSPENQIFQWSVTTTNLAWPEESRNTSSVYLWIPENCTKLRGLLILGANVPEHMLVGHPAIREVCTTNNLGIIWAVPTFWNFRKELKGRDETQVAFLEHLLADLAEKSGYPEVATVPWLPIGESGHLLMVCGLINERPDRCIAGICVKNPHEPQNKTIPLLWTLGTAQEWGQMKKDIRQSWLDAGAYPDWMSLRVENSWPLSLVVEFGTGHFYCSNAMVEYFAAYIDAATKARLPADGSPQLKPVDLNDGVLAHLPLSGQTDLAVIPYATASPEQRRRPWFFNESLAAAAQKLSQADPAAAPQLVGVEAGEGCRTEPYALNSVTRLFVKGDGIFTVRPSLLDRIPDGFVAAGEPLAKAEGQPVSEWICGPYAPDGPDRFRISPDRTWTGRGPVYLIVKHEGDKLFRRTVQPVHVTIEKNDSGVPQTITFNTIDDAPSHVRTIALSAVSDAGLPVSFFVNHGPAIIEGSKLHLTPVPPGAKFPVEVSVTAWQWGRASDPPIQTAAPVTKTFFILPPDQSNE